ncbi:MAG: LacI family DNA-binding transcriptional regulator [Actinomycetales bacterium]
MPEDATDDAGRRLRRPPVMADVAVRAGVSHQTVSRVVNGSPAVSEATRQRVVAAMHELRYRPNASAQALKRRRTRTVGVVCSDTTLYGPASTLFGLEAAARAAGYSVRIASLRELDADSVQDALDFLAQQAVDGVAVIAPQRSAVDALAKARPEVPAVVVEGDATGVFATARVDQVLGGRLATQYLIRLGHETVRHLAGPVDWLEAEGREHGWATALRESGRTLPPVLRGDWSPRSGYEAGKLLSGDGDVTAVFVANDQMALGVLRAFREAGVSVPEDVSIVGFDDIPEADFFPPPLTTVRQDFAELGRRCLALLLTAMSDDPDPDAAAVIAPQLVVRQSTAPPRILRS